jgi:cysteine-rich repeat protein
VHVLFIAASPRDAALVTSAEESRAISVALDLAPHGGRFQVKWIHAAQHIDIVRALNNGRFDIVHFAGHATPDSIVLTTSGSTSDLIPTEAFSAVFEHTERSVRLVILNGCWTENHVDRLLASVDCAVGMSSAIYNTSAVRFTEVFYTVLASGASVGKAFRQASPVFPQTTSRSADQRDVVSEASREDRAGQPVLKCRGALDADDLSFGRSRHLRWAIPAVFAVVMSGGVAAWPTEDLCGDSTRQGTERCDKGGDAPDCDSDCTLPLCGDGHLNRYASGGEQCDDGNSADGDGCSMNCRREPDAGPPSRPDGSIDAEVDAPPPPPPPPPKPRTRCTVAPGDPHGGPFSTCEGDCSVYTSPDRTDNPDTAARLKSGECDEVCQCPG